MPDKRTILVVDDESDVIKSIADLLRLDYRVLGATGAEQALDQLKGNEVHVVLCDQRMPGITGAEFLSRLRSEHPDIIRLMITGYADISAVIDAINRGSVFRYVAKPWDPDELQAIVRQAVEHYSLVVGRKALLIELELKNAALQRAVEQLTQANELKTAFIRVASHELRTPMTILNAAAKIMLQVGSNDPEMQPWIERIDRAATWMQHLVNQLLTMLMVGQYELSPQREATDVSELVSQSVDDVRPFVLRRNQSLSTDVAADLGKVQLDSSMIRNALDHLLLNAIKFTPDGGKISVSARRLDPIRGGVELNVRDTGLGIDTEHQVRLFEPFFTGFDVSRHSSGTFEYGKRGLGLGLSMVKAFVEMHGGTIGVQSQPGQGTLFTVKLPMAA